MAAAAAQQQIGADTAVAEAQERASRAEAALEAAQSESAAQSEQAQAARDAAKRLAVRVAELELELRRTRLQGGDAQRLALSLTRENHELKSQAATLENRLQQQNNTVGSSSGDIAQNVSAALALAIGSRTAREDVAECAAVLAERAAAEVARMLAEEQACQDNGATTTSSKKHGTSQEQRVEEIVGNV